LTNPRKQRGFVLLEGLLTIYLTAPAADLGVAFADEAAARIVDESAGYPYFIQEYGLEVWNYADSSPISIDDVSAVREIVNDSLARSFFGTRFELATDAEQVTVHADATIALPLLVTALAASARATISRRKPLAFDLSGATMGVNGRPFPQARFEARFDAVERRLGTLEEQVGKQALDTKPMWERALAEILEVKQTVNEVKADVNALKADVDELKANVNELKADVNEVKTDVKDIKRKITVLTQDMMQLRADQLGLERRMDALDSRPQ